MILLAACYAPAVPEAPCSPNGACPDGQTCTAGKCVLETGRGTGTDAMPDTPIITAQDRDGDGKPDSTDNCPDTKNPDQANEDGDAFGDACDLCPQIAETTQTDTDGDKIGNACDPNPAAKDSVWLFEGFHAGMPAWAGSTHWAATTDKLRVTAGGASADPGEYLTLPLTSTNRVFDNFSVTATIVVDQNAGNEHDIGFSIYDASRTKSLWCELEQGSAGSVLALADDNNPNRSSPFAWTTGTEYRLTLTRHAGNYTCTVLGPAGATQTITAGSSIVPQAGDAVEIGAFGVTAQFGSVAVIGP
jgi:thrombospondin type 3 repeat protein